MIESIELINWKSHSHSKLDFAKGTNVLVGRIGSGKSSIMDALCFAFFGVFPALQRKNVSVNELIMNKPIQKESSIIKVKFKVNEKNYLVERKIFYEKNKSSQAKLFENNRLIAGPKVKEVNERIEEILTVSYELFSRAVYSEQNGTDYFLRLSPRERKEKFDELFELQKFELVRSNSVTLKNKLKIVINGKKETEKILGEQLKKEESKGDKKILEDLKTDEKKLINEEKKIKTDIVRLEEKMKNIEKKSKEYKRLDEKLISLKSEINLKEKEAAELDEKTKELKETENIKEVMEKTSKELNEIEEKLIELTKKENELLLVRKTIKEEEEKLEIQKNRLKSELKGKNIDEVIKEKNELLLKTKNELKELNEKMISSQKEINNVKVEKESIKNKMLEEKNHLIELKKAKAFCPVCRTALTLAKKTELINEKEAMLKTAEKQIKEKSMEEEKIRNNIKIMEKRMNELKMNETNINNWLVRAVALKEAENDIKEKTKKIKEKREQEEKLQKELKKLDKENLMKEKIRKNKLIEIIKEKIRLIEIKKSLKDKKFEAKKLQSELNELNFDEKKEKQLLAEFERKKERKNSIKEKIELIKQSIKEKELKIEDIKNKSKQLKDIQTSINLLNARETDLKVFINSLESAQTILRKTLIETINQALEEIWPKLYPYKDIEKIKIIISEKDYDIKAEVKGKLLRIEGILSGGERTAAALAIRVALAFVLAKNVSMLILDEPTHNLDTEAISSLSSLLRMQLPELVEQIFLITHDSEMEKAASSKLFKLERKKKELEATKVMELELK